MYSYFTNVILSVDIYLLCLFVFMAISIIIYVLVSQNVDNKRKRALLKIKRHVYDLVLSDNEGKTAACPMIDFSPQQFLDIETNRIRDAVFFNKEEQVAFRDCFVTPEKIEKIARIAEKAFDKWKRIEAIISLGYMSASSQMKVLRKSLFNKDEDISYFSMISLAQIKNAAAARALIELLRKNPRRRRKIVSILETFSEDAAEEASPLLKDKDPNVRFWALKLLAKLKSGKYIKAIEALTTDKNEDVRAAACECIGKIGKADSKDSIIKCLKDGAWSVRVAAIKGLSDLLGDKCISEITFLTNDNSLSVIDVLTDVIAKHIHSAIGFIEKSLYGGDPVSKRIAIEAMENAGYLTNILKDILSDDDKKRASARHFLEGILASGKHAGLEAALDILDKEARNKILVIIKDIDTALADHMERKLKGSDEEPW